jgi:hypothetical protein
LYQQHLATAAAELERSDDPVVKDWPGIPVLRTVHPVQRGIEQAPLFVA